MDLPAETTILLHMFHDRSAAVDVLTSHGFNIINRSADEVRIQGSFLNLIAAKADLEQLLQTQNNTRPVPTASSGAISKYYSNNRSTSGSRDKPLHESPDSPRNRLESFIIDADVLRYAERFRQKEIGLITTNHDVKMEVNEFNDNCDNCILRGKQARVAARKLQELLTDLRESLRTQEVPRKDMGREGRLLLEEIRNKHSVYNSVLVCETVDGLHLVGPSGESYELKQKLLRRSSDASSQTRPFQKNVKGRSSSLPAANRRRRDGDGHRGAAASDPFPAGASGYTPTNHHHHDRQDAANYRSDRGGIWGRSFSLTRGIKRSQKASNDFVEESGNEKKPRERSRFSLKSVKQSISRMFGKSSKKKTNHEK